MILSFGFHYRLGLHDNVGLKTWVLPAVSALSLANCVAWGKLLNLSVLSLLICKAEMILGTGFIGLLWH